MAIETFEFIDDLNAANPTATDNVSEGDDHLRGLKTTLKNTFPNVTGAINATETELNYVDGVTSDIQTQLDTKLSSVADNSVTLAKMAGGTDGNLITYDASGDPAYVTTGTSGQVLTSGGAGVAPTFQTAASGATGMDDVSGVARATSGLLFNGDTAAANVLDDYEEGTWTPTFLNTTVSAGPSTTTGRYTKIGNTVHVEYYGANLTLSGGSMRMGGLPFTVADNGSYSNFQYTHGNATGSITTGGYFVASNTQMYFITQGTTNISNWSSSASLNLMVSGTYTVA